jgi:hypothetical protein
MDPDEASVPRPATAPGDRLERLSAAARGWHASRWQSWASSASAASCAPQPVRPRGQSNGSPPRWRSPRWPSHACQSSPSAGSPTPSVTSLTATAMWRAACPATRRNPAHHRSFDPGSDRSAIWLVAIARQQPGGRGHRHHRSSLVRPARQRASRCHQRPHRQRHHHRAHPGHHPSQPS